MCVKRNERYALCEKLVPKEIHHKYIIHVYDWIIMDISNSNTAQW
jgi:hypothetical protein